MSPVYAKKSYYKVIPSQVFDWNKILFLSSNSYQLNMAVNSVSVPSTIKLQSDSPKVSLLRRVAQHGVGPTEAHRMPQLAPVRALWCFDETSQQGKVERQCWLHHVDLMIGIWEEFQEPGSCLTQVTEIKVMLLVKNNNGNF